MMDKQTLIDNVAEYTATELARFIKEGIVSFEELCEEPDFSASARKTVKELINASEEEVWQNAQTIDSLEEYENYLKSYPEGNYRSEAREAKKRLQQSSSISEIEDAWQSVEKNDEEALRDFITKYPTSYHASKAEEYLSNLSRKRYSTSDINRLKNEIEGENDPNIITNTIKKYLENNSISSNQLYSELKNNHNILSSGVINRLEGERIIDFTRLELEADINPKFLEYITNNDVESLVINVPYSTIDSIGPQTTEIYFWGIPSSGKTCALGAIMSEARHGGYIDFAEPNTKCQGYHYMTVLSQLFEGGGEIFKLPEGNQTDEIFEMGYTFKKGNKEYPVTFIDLAGETISSMFYSDANLSLSPQARSGLETACNLLTGNHKINRKIHFFVLEYGGHTKKYKDLTQETLLTGALSFIKETGIFKTETDAVYLLLTKSDLTGASSEEERNKILGDYITNYYKQFYNGLKSLCAENEINGGNVDIVPFSLGDVCFQNLCLFDNTTAATVVELIVNKVKGFKLGKLSKIINRLKK